MKKILISACLICQCIGVFAQQVDNTRYKLPDGKIVTYDKLDSVEKAWGSKQFRMQHDAKQPDLVFISPMTNDIVKAIDGDKAELNKLLNQPAPDFTLTDLAGKRWTLSSLRGKTVVLNFWFVACPGCVEEMPHLNDLVKSYHGQPVVFLGLALDDAKALKNFLTQHKFAYNLFPKAGAVSKPYHVSMYPTSFVIDPNGVIRFAQLGGENIEQQITDTIKNFAKR
ncbi:TlpA family protein disulfide reductase [Mucilaginibacter rigui]|uniref:TlpA family protein disulfide reductase n=1 Tax=Mucilaginibacter rigui TaxID=534635 RepID=A0ABR7X801_9SPHI|nr:TlpA disulfide reductase family protein [Mucilaginibacter rigui]MBD1386709.1 TlpA family protein disulfide reductase [Mucilaginibacter rigui]